MSTDQLDSLQSLLFIAETHRKVINYHQYVLDSLSPQGAERSRIVGYILREEKELADIGQIVGLTPTEMSTDLPVDLAALQAAIDQPQERS
jgi:hypothetical protein